MIHAAVERSDGDVYPSLRELTNCADDDAQVAENAQRLPGVEYVESCLSTSSIPTSLQRICWCSQAHRIKKAMAVMEWNGKYMQNCHTIVYMASTRVGRRLQLEQIV
uniref:Uncharacterized protein n=1 Tax=Ascaris lumbricoides TaxID=6252 RepID=A0A0M3HUZ0_ASCLU